MGKTYSKEERKWHRKHEKTRKNKKQWLYDNKPKQQDKNR